MLKNKNAPPPNVTQLNSKPCCGDITEAYKKEKSPPNLIENMSTQERNCFSWGFKQIAMCC